MASNTNVIVMSEGKQALGDFLKFWENHHFKVVGWSEKSIDAHVTWGTKKGDENKFPTLVLYWCEKDADNKLPFDMKTSETVDLVWGWLEKGPWPKRPDHDGDNGHGWFAFTDFWGHVGSDRTAIIGFQRCWAMYGK